MTQREIMPRNILPYKGIYPQIAENVFIAPGASVIGNVSIGKWTGVWFGCVIRSDVERITIGERTNIQDGTIIHVWRDDGPTFIGSGVTIGHKVLLHACTLEDECFIGMAATVMDKAVVEKGAMVAAGALVTPGKRIPSGQLWAGSPAKYFRDLTPKEHDYIKISADNYVKHVEEYLQEFKSF